MSKCNSGKSYSYSILRYLSGIPGRIYTLIAVDPYLPTLYSYYLLRDPSALHKVLIL